MTERREILLLPFGFILLGCQVEGNPLEIHRCEASVDKLEGDPFEAGAISTRTHIGVLDGAEWAGEVSRSLNRSGHDLRVDIPAMGVIARVRFLDSNGKSVAEGWIYLPDGELVMFTPAMMKMRVPNLNKAGLTLLQEKDPIMVERLRTLMDSHGLQWDRLTNQ
tara:strand:- start:340 stop:831 length:492 start_codon:yes stop_codon:yes gene_type:complete